MGNTYFKHRGLHKYTRGSRWSGAKEHDRFGAGEEGYAAVCVRYEGSKRNGMSLLRLLTCETGNG